MLARIFSFLTAPRGFWIFLALYGLVLLALRLLLLPAASQDDSEQLLFAQVLAGGYNPAQPPLYTWLVVAAQAVVGVGLGAVVLVKFACLLAIYGFLYLAARQMISHRRLAALAALSPLGLYYVAWDAVLNYSNTVLMAAACAATLYALARVAKGGGGWSHAGLGAAMGVGFMAKYGYALFLAALLVAALSERAIRSRLLDRRALIAAMILLVALAPHGIWLFSDGRDLAAGLGARLDAGIDGGYLAGVGNALAKLANSILVFLLPLAAVLPIFFAGAFGRIETDNQSARAWMRLFERFFVAAIAMIVVGILFLGVTTVRSHYMFILLPLPIYFFLRVEAARATLKGGMTARAAGYAAALMGFTLLALGGLAVKGAADPQWCRKCYFHVPYEALADALRGAGFTQGTIAVHFHRYQMAGNFRRMFPDSRIISSKYPSFAPPPRPGNGAKGKRGVGQCLLVWQAEAGAVPPPALLQLVSWQDASADGGPARVASAKLRRSSERVFEIGFAMWPAGRGDCR